MDIHLDVNLMKARHRELATYLEWTPVCPWGGRQLDALMPDGATVIAKLEQFQKTGTFKARGALSNVLALDDAQRRSGVTGASAGNHAIAIAFAAKAASSHAKVVMQASANPARIRAAEAFGAELVMAVDGRAAFAKVDEIATNDGRAVIHPFDGEHTVLGTAGVGLELFEDCPNLDAVLVAVGGGGLAAGVSAAIKSLNPNCEVYGVEPEGAAAMSRSFKTGKVVTLDRIETIADSLAPPMTMPYSLSVCRHYIDEIVVVSDAAICRAMALMFEDRGLAVEPAAAATTAALIGPLREKLAGKRVAIIVCGSNIDFESYEALVRQGLGR